jgi:hypothetical protein
MAGGRTRVRGSFFCPRRYPPKAQSNGRAKSISHHNAGHFSAHLWRLKVQRQQRHR